MAWEIDGRRGLAAGDNGRMKTTVAVIGGGLSGLCAARRLHAAGIDVRVIEARPRLGGRILSTDEHGAPSDDGFDLGPSWCWPRVQPQLAALVQELGLDLFPQHTRGDVLFERMSRETPQRCQASDQEPQSMRIVGGTSALTAALVAQLPADRVLPGTHVTHMALGHSEVELTTRRDDGSIGHLLADQVVAAVPPRLLTQLAFSPAIDETAARRWADTATWMAPHAKVFAVYDRPFWRDAGLSGTAQSFVGPLGEIHDATTASGKAALFGFVSVGADARAAIGEAALVAACVQQFARLFGPEALQPRATLVKDWSTDPLTALASDRVPSGHPHPSAAPWVTGVWQARLSLCASETSATEPGYLAGAVSAAERAALEVAHRLAPTR